MDETTLGLVVSAAALAGLLGVAFLLQRRARSNESLGGAAHQAGIPLPGPLGRALWTVTKILIAATILSLAATFLFQTMAFAWLAGGLLLLALVIGFVRGLINLLGK